jgi:enoyl-CoA hydratase/carnithine racemase
MTDDPNTQLETVNLTVTDDGVATIQLNRPEALNAWNRRRDHSGRAPGHL